MCPDCEGVMSHDEVHLYDVVALTEALPEEGLLRGQVGSVVEIYPDGACEVDFSDAQGNTYALLAVQRHMLMRLHYSRVSQDRE